MYTITDISKMFNLPASTIRYYEKIGLLENVEHKDDYHRIYNEEHVQRLTAIECFKKALLPLSDIRTFFEYEKDIQNHSGDIIEMMKKQEYETRLALTDLELGLAHIQKKVKYFSAVDEAIKAGKPVPACEDVIGE